MRKHSRVINKLFLDFKENDDHEEHDSNTGEANQKNNQSSFVNLFNAGNNLKSEKINQLISRFIAEEN